MATVTLQEAQANLSDLIRQLSPGDELLITEHDRPVAKLTCQGGAIAQRPGPGLCQGMLTILADDEEHLTDFAEYMP